MNKNEGMISCAVGCWLVALLGGVLAAMLLMVLGGWTFMQGVFMGVVVFVVAGALLSWIICKPLPAAGEASIASEPANTAERPTAAKPTASAAGASAAVAATATTAPEVKPSAPLPGEAELAARKGEWKYEGDGTKADAPAEAAKPAKKAKKAAKKPEPAAEPIPDYDGDGVLEGTAEGTKPAGLDGPRDGKADNLKEIKGIGPKLEALCNSMGFYHFDQIAQLDTGRGCLGQREPAGFQRARDAR